MKLRILHPEGESFSGEVDQLWCPGLLGGFEVLNRHVPFISALKSGTLRYGSQKKATSLAIQGGFVEVSHNQAIVLLNAPPQ